MDQADIAQADYERAMHRFERSLAGRVDLPSQTHCVYCDHAIPSARRQHLPGVETCVACQSLIEQGVSL